MKVALGQINMVWEDKKINKNKCSEFISLAKKLQCDIIVFPEMTLTGFSKNIKKIKERKVNSDTIEFFQREALVNKIVVVFGMVIEKLGKCYNSCIIINEKGEFISSYDKIHPFSHGGESKGISGGGRLAFFNYENISFSSFICYDLRFPEPFIKASYSAEAIILIANWPKCRVDQWDILLRARAIETQSYIIAVNRTGDGDNISYNGHSMVINPYGKVISEVTENEEIIVADLDIKVVDKYREDFPYKTDRKDMIYKYL